MAASGNASWSTRFGIGLGEPGQRSYGLISAIDSRTDKIVWQQRSSYPLGHGGVGERELVDEVWHRTRRTGPAVVRADFGHRLPHRQDRVATAVVVSARAWRRRGTRVGRRGLASDSANRASGRTG